jgi:hypothetical protein
MNNENPNPDDTPADPDVEKVREVLASRGLIPTGKFTTVSQDAIHAAIARIEDRLSAAHEALRFYADLDTIRR